MESGPLLMEKSTSNNLEKEKQIFQPSWKHFPKTTLDNVSGCLKYSGKTKTLKEMDDAIRQRIETGGFSGS